MTPAQIIALVRDILVVGALSWVVWRLYTDGENRVRQQDLEAVNKQLLQNQQEQYRWEQEKRDAESKASSEREQLAAAIGAQHAPVIVRVPSGAGTVPSTSPSAPGGTACAGGSEAGSGVDVRPGINAFETKYEGYLASCRAVLNEWPK
jgi:hypothetical protein